MSHSHTVIDPGHRHTICDPGHTHEVIAPRPVPKAVVVAQRVSVADELAATRHASLFRAIGNMQRQRYPF